MLTTDMHAANCVFVVKFPRPRIHLPFGSLADEALATVAALLSSVKGELLGQQSICRFSDCTTSTTWLAQPWHLCKTFTASRVPERLVTMERRAVGHSNSFLDCSFAAGANCLLPPHKAAWKRLTAFATTT
ncbi:hypothetical protein TRVL_07761 [Trypanosoma vivax]|nr:hypothetical protein TRVL_07761 [Trypanosoma vivax]